MRRRKCKQNKRYRTSVRIITKVLPAHGTDGQTDGQSATQYAAPSYGGGRRIKKAFREVTRNLSIARQKRNLGSVDPQPYTLNLLEFRFRLHYFGYRAKFGRCL